MPVGLVEEVVFAVDDVVVPVGLVEEVVFAVDDVVVPVGLVEVVTAETVADSVVPETVLSVVAVVGAVLSPGCVMIVGALVTAVLVVENVDSVVAVVAVVVGTVVREAGIAPSVSNVISYFSAYACAVELS